MSNSEILTDSMPERSFNRPAIETANAEKRQNLIEPVFASPEVQQMKKQFEEKFHAHPAAKTSDGAETLPTALDQMMKSFIVLALTMDVEQPEFLWWLTPPFTAKSGDFGGARFGLDNSDNIYQIVSIDPSSTYTIHGIRQGTGPAQYTVGTYPAYIMNDNRNTPDLVEAILPELVLAENRRDYTITVSPKPNEGRKNYIQNTDNGRFLFIRQSLSNWHEQQPDIVWITNESVMLENPSEISLQRYIDEALVVLERSLAYWFYFMDNAIYSLPVNTLSPPIPRDGGWGFASYGHFSLQPGQALVITMLPEDASYVSLMAADPWMASVPYIDQSGSFNQSQAKANRDGSYTFVVTPESNAVYNWLDTDGLYHGQLMARWQGVPARRRENFKGFSEVRVIDLDEVDQEIQAEIRSVTPVQRKQILEDRSSSWYKRLEYNKL